MKWLLTRGDAQCVAASICEGLGRGNPPFDDARPTSASEHLRKVLALAAKWWHVMLSALEWIVGSVEVTLRAGQIFGRMGMEDREIVCLMGAHTIGRAHKNRSGAGATSTVYTEKGNSSQRTCMHTSLCHPGTQQRALQCQCGEEFFGSEAARSQARAGQRGVRAGPRNGSSSITGHFTQLVQSSVFARFLCQQLRITRCLVVLECVSANDGILATSFRSGPM